MGEFINNNERIDGFRDRLVRGDFPIHSATEIAIALRKALIGQIANRSSRFDILVRAKPGEEPGTEYLRLGMTPPDDLSELFYESVRERLGLNVVVEHSGPDDDDWGATDEVNIRLFSMLSPVVPARQVHSIPELIAA